MCIRDRDNAAMNIGVHISFPISVFRGFLGIYPGVELLGHMVVLVLGFVFLFFLHSSYYLLLLLILVF